MRAFLSFFILAITLLGLTNAQICNPACTRELDPHCGVTSRCLVPASNPCFLRYKSCIFALNNLPPIYHVMPGRCPIYLPICPGT